MPANTNGILIAPDNVTLDLGGFSITTPPPAFVPPFTDGITSSGGAVSSAVAIKNGAIRGFTNPIEPVGDTKFWRLEDLVLDSGIPAGGTISIDLGSYTRVWHVTASQANLHVTSMALGEQRKQPALLRAQRLSWRVGRAGLLKKGHNLAGHLRRHPS